MFSELFQQLEKKIKLSENDKICIPSFFEIKKLQKIVQSQSLAIADLKKEMNLEYLTI